MVCIFVAGGGRRSIHVSYLGCRAQFNIGRLGLLLFPKFYNGNSVENRPAQPPRPALPRPSKHVSWTVALGVAMRSHCARDDDDEEQSRDNSGDTVQNDHSDGRRRRGAQWVLCLVLIATGIAVAIAISWDTDSVFLVGGKPVDGSEDKARVVFVRHGVDGEELHHLLGTAGLVVAVVGRGAVQDDGRDVGLLVGLLKDGLGIVEARVVAGVAADVGDIVGRDVCDAGEVGVVQIALDLVVSIPCQRQALVRDTGSGRHEPNWLPAASRG